MANPSTLSATYTAPGDEKKFTHPLPSTKSAPSTDERINYLSALREKTKDLQTEINIFLTQKMDDEKAAIGTSINEDREEENYGEEVVED
jgi:hypothetical protein